LPNGAACARRARYLRDLVDVDESSIAGIPRRCRAHRRILAVSPCFVPERGGAKAPLAGRPAAGFRGSIVHAAADTAHFMTRNCRRRGAARAMQAEGAPFRGQL
jgi:hypothetical protein